MKVVNPLAEELRIKDLEPMVTIGITEKDSPMFRSGIFLLKPGEGLPWESHGSDEMFYVIRGSLTVSDKAGASNTLSAGDVLLISAGEEHASKNLMAEDVMVFWVNGG